MAQCLATLKERNSLMDARRKQIDPKTGQQPQTHVGRQRLRKYLAEEPARLDHTFEVLIGTYEESFGAEAADAFRKAGTARHAGIAVISEHWGRVPADAPNGQTARRVRASSALPVPKPLPTSVASGIFGRDECGKPIRPSPREVRAITEQHAEQMMDMQDEELRSGASKYAEDFGEGAAAQLVRYVQRTQARSR
jgi:hypothetical protein